MRSAQRSEPVSVLDRIVAVLDAVREAGGTTTVTQLAAATGIPKSTTSRTVAELVRRGYLTRSGTRVCIGMRLYALGARASTPRRLGLAALPILAELFEATGEHLNVAVRAGREMVSIVAVRGRLRPAPSRAGARVPAATTALGKAVIAFSQDDAAFETVTMHLDDRGRDLLHSELDAIRRRRVAIDRCQTFPGVVGVASPVLSRDRVPIAAISVAGPADSMDVERVAPLVRHAGLALTRRLGAQTA